MTPNEPAAPSGRFSAEALGMIAAGLGTLLFSTKPILVKLAYAEGLGPEALIGLRMLVSMPFYILIGVVAYRRLERRIAWRAVVASVAIGTLGYYMAAYFDLLALVYISAQLERIVLFTYPAWVVLFAALFFGEPITGRKLGALALAYLGVVIVVGHDFALGNQTGLFFGIACVFASIFSYSAYLLLSKRYIALFGTGLFTSIAMGTSSVAIALHLTVAGRLGDLQIEPDLWPLIIMLALGATVAPAYLITFAVGRVGAGTTSIIATIGPPVTSIFAVAILAEVFTIYHAAGLVLTCAGILVLTWGGLIKRRASGP